MEFPSLLYPEKNGKGQIPRSVPDDLQLTQLLPGKVFDCALVPCTAEEIPLRHELFRLLAGETPFRTRLCALREAAEEIASLDAALYESGGEEEKSVITAFLLDACLRFFDLASSYEGEKPFLYARFAGAMARNAEALSPVREALSSLLPTFSGIRSYTLRLHGKSIKGKKDGEESYLSRILTCAENLGVERPTLPQFPEKQLSPELLSSLATLTPETFAAFSRFSKQYGGEYGDGILSYADQLGFYLSFARLFDRVREHSVPLTYPTLREERGIFVRQAYDISLFAKNEYGIVPNDIEFTPDQPFYYLTGANGGGKTTYLRAVGIACVLLLLGCPLPCEGAEMSVPSGIFTHFPRDERFDGSGRFVEEQRRVEAILDAADENAVILLNETYSTTNEENAVNMTVKLAETLFSRRMFGLYITHQHSIAQTEIPYLNVLVDREDGNRRTYRIVKMRNVGDSFAQDILKKYGLTREALEERFGKEGK